ncbi:MAG: mechanosensitive ion channel family protein [Roseobacter sp.]
MSDTRIEIIVSGENAAATMEQLTSQLPDTAEIVADTVAPPTLIDLFASGVQASGGLGEQVSQWFANIAASGGIQPPMTLLICVAIFAVAYGVERFAVQAYLSRTARAGSNTDGDGNALGSAIQWGIVSALGLLLFFGLSQIGIRAIIGASGEAHELAIVALTSVMLPRAWLFIVELLSASKDKSRRANSLTDTEAGSILRAALLLVAFFAVTAFTRDFVVGVVDAGDSGAIFAVLTRALDLVAASVFFFVIRQPVGGLITRALAGDADEPASWVRLLGRFWPALYIFLMALQVLAEARGYLSGALGEDAAALKRSFAIFVITPFVVAALGIWKTQLLEKAEQSSHGRIAGIFSILEGGITVGAAVVILYAWDIDPFATDLVGAQRILPGLVSAAIVTVIGMSAWRTVSGFLTMGSKDQTDGGDGVPEGEGGVGGSRIETVFPILRTALAVLIGTVTVLLALSSLGVQIAPLLAGAGILGLAIGFGAQKIVEDIIAGVLYLVEDAFRKGEYIETAQGKGVVEAIMLRSVRLRHHLGAVYTVPFSSMGTIQNHSRDWVTVKLSFEVSPTQDLEKVRKLVKKVGAQLMEDPELEGQFLAPLKSQGAVALVGSNYKIGVKFTSKPGEQFLIRRKALNAIQKAFADNNIQMAAPRVIVDSISDADAAAAKVIQDAAQTPG